MVYALDFLHSKDIVHQDVGPHSIFFEHDPDRSPSTRVMLGNFGRAVILKENQETSVRGTERGFAPPEKACSAVGDVWSLGATIYVFATMEGKASYLSEKRVKLALKDCKKHLSGYSRSLVKTIIDMLDDLDYRPDSKQLLEIIRRRRPTLGETLPGATAEEDNAPHGDGDAGPDEVIVESGEVTDGPEDMDATDDNPPQGKATNCPTG